MAAALIGLLGVARPAFAHASLLATTPSAEAVVETAPTVVELRFSEPVASTAGGVRVLGPSGRRVDPGRIDLERDETVVRVPIESTDRGSYTVAWRVTSEDGHTITGSFVFHVGEITGGIAVADGVPPAVRSLGTGSRAVAFAGVLLALGAAVLAVVGSREPVVQRRLERLAGVGLIGGGLASAVLLVALTAEGTGRSLPDALRLVQSFATEQRTGTLIAARAAALLVTGAVTMLLRPVRRSGAWRWVAVAGASAATLFTAAGGHPWTTSPRAVVLVGDVVHQAGAAIWLGGAAGLAAVFGVSADTRELAHRFSSVALAAAVAVGISGTASAWAQARSLDALTSTTHGRLIIAKAVGFTLLIGLGWRIRARVLPDVERKYHSLLHSLRVELAVGVAVVTLTAVAVGQQPARLAVARPFEASLTTGGLTVQATIAPARVGANELHLYFLSSNGIAANVDAVQIDATTGTIPPRRLRVIPISPSHVTVAPASFTSPGVWTLQIVAVRVGEPTTFTMEVPIR